MGVMKKLMMEQLDFQATAVEILCDARVIKECEFHEGIYFEGTGGVTEAYKLANFRISKGELHLPDDKGRRDLTDMIKQKYEELSIAGDCWVCAKPD